MSQAEEWQKKEIYKREDGSYVIHNPHPYHVPNEGEWADLWSQVTAYLAAKGITPDAEPLPPPPPPPTDEEKAEAVIQQRNALLTASDYTQMADYPIAPEKREEWAVYRQALRDIPEQPGFPWEVEWPVPPSK